MKPFSTFKFFTVNKKKGLLAFIVIILTVCAVSLITGLINSIFDTVNEVDLKMFEKFSIVYTSNMLTGLPKDTVDKLKSDKDIKELLAVDGVDFTDISLAIGGNTSIPVLFAPSESNKKMQQIVGDTLKQGRMPNSGAYEIVVHWKVMNNKGWKLGQKVGSDVNDDEYLNGKYKIVGVLDGPTVICFGGKTKSYDDYKKAGLIKKDKVYAYTVIPKDGKRNAVNKLIGSFDKKKISSDTYDSLKKDIDKSLSSLSGMLTAIIVIVVFILSISIGALMYLIYMQRSDEFGILAAMGYRRSFTRNLIIKEVTSLNLISWVFGMLLSVGMIVLLNIYVYTPKGTPLTVISVSVIENTLIIPVMVAVFSLLPILIKLRRQDAITIIERRD